MSEEKKIEFDKSKCGDREYMIKFVQIDGGTILDKNWKYLEYASEELKKDKKFFLEVIEKTNGYSLQYAAEELKKDKQFVLEAVKESGCSLEYAAEELKKDKQFVLEAVKENGYSLQYAAEELKKDKQIVLEAVKKNGGSLDYAAEELKKDKQIVLEAVKENGCSLQYAAEELKKDKQIVLEAVKQNGYSLKYAAEELKKDYKIIVQAIKEDGFAFEHLDENFKRESCLLKHLEINGLGCYISNGKLKDGKEFALEAVKNNGMSFCYVSKKFQNDREIMIEAIKENGLILIFRSQHFSNILKKDKSSFTEELKRNKLDCYIATNNENFKEDDELRYEAVKNNGLGLKYISSRDANYKMLVLEAVKQNAKAYIYASEEIKVDNRFVLKMIKQNKGVMQYIDEKRRKKIINLIESNNNNVFSRILSKDIKILQINYKELQKIEKVGEGQFGVVWKMKRVSNSNIVAMKEILMDLNVESYQKIIKNEVQLVKFLAFPGIVYIHGYTNISEKRIGIIMEYVNGGDIHQYITNNKRKLSNIWKWNCIKSMTQSVFYLHSRGVIHRDIKTTNFLIEKDGKRIVICDFGLVKMINSSTVGSTSGKIKGTPQFLSPEIVNSSIKKDDEDSSDDDEEENESNVVESSNNSIEIPYSVKSDVFSLGMAFHEVIYERVPFQNLNPLVISLKISQGVLPKVPKKLSKQPEEFKEILKMCFEYDTVKRCTASQLLEYMKKNESKFLKKYCKTEKDKILNREINVQHEIGVIGEASVEIPESMIRMKNNCVEECCNLLISFLNRYGFRILSGEKDSNEEDFEDFVDGGDLIIFQNLFKCLEGEDYCKIFPHYKRKILILDVLSRYLEYHLIKRKTLEDNSRVKFLYQDKKQKVDLLNRVKNVFYKIGEEKKGDRDIVDCITLINEAMMKVASEKKIKIIPIFTDTIKTIFSIATKDIGGIITNCLSVLVQSSKEISKLILSSKWKSMWYLCLLEIRKLYYGMIHMNNPSMIHKSLNYLQQFIINLPSKKINSAYAYGLYTILGDLSLFSVSDIMRKGASDLLSKKNVGGKLLQISGKTVGKKRIKLWNAIIKGKRTFF